MKIIVLLDVKLIGRKEELSLKEIVFEHPLDNYYKDGGVM